MEEGLIIKTNTEIGVQLLPQEIIKKFDAVCIAIGSEEPRDLPVPGRDLDGIHFAMEYLTQQNKINSGHEIPYDYLINAKDKEVIVLGGGDTGSDCVGTAVRQGAKRITQIEILPKPQEVNGKENPSWPYTPIVLKTTSSHEEGCRRLWGLSTLKFNSDQRRVTSIDLIEVDWEKDKQGHMKMKEIPGSERTLNADLVLLSMGFVNPVQAGIIEDLKLKVSNRKNLMTDKTHRTNQPKVFAAGDAKNGASLVVTAIYSGRMAAQGIDEFLRK